MMETPISQNEIESSDSEDLLEFYADDMSINSGLYTAILSFGVMGPDQSRTVRARIRVSPHMLKAISLLIAKNIGEFEGVTGGEIRLPSGLVDTWRLEAEA